MGQITSDLIIAARVGGTRGTDWIEKNFFFCLLCHAVGRVEG